MKEGASLERSIQAQMLIGAPCAERSRAAGVGDGDAGAPARMAARSPALAEVFASLAAAWEHNIQPLSIGALLFGMQACWAR